MLVSGGWSAHLAYYSNTSNNYMQRKVTTVPVNRNKLFIIKICFLTEDKSIYVGMPPSLSLSLSYTISKNQHGESSGIVYTR